MAVYAVLEDLLASHGILLRSVLGLVQFPVLGVQPVTLMNICSIYRKAYSQVTADRIYKGPA